VVVSYLKKKKLKSLSSKIFFGFKIVVSILFLLFCDQILERTVPYRTGFGNFSLIFKHKIGLIN
jgi:hypothetical protein